MVFPKIGKKESAKKDGRDRDTRIGVEQSEQREEKSPSSKKEKALSGRLHAIIKAPRVTEKSSSLVSAANTYTFEVSLSATKGAIKNAVEALYGVDVADVRIIRIPPKRRRLGRYEGERKQIKKALVKVKEGQKIDIGL